MQPVTKNKLAANAYRTLGLSASAGQAAIENAARRMRIWPDGANIPPTAWDLVPQLGAVARSRRNIEQAVAVLTEPRTRVEERLLWYQAGDARAVEKLNTPAAGTANVADDPAEAHDAALADLHRAYRMDAAVNDPHNWMRLMGGWSALAKSPQYLDWLAKVEGEGDFEKRASVDEINAALATLVPAVTIALIPAAEAAMGRPGADSAALAALMRMAGSSESDSAPVQSLLDNLEDTLRVNCREMEIELRDRLLTNHQNPGPYFARNSEAALKAATFYNGSISLSLKNFCDLAAGDEDRLIRAKSTCAAVLALLGLGWEWAGQYITAELTYEMALELAQGSPAATPIVKDLQRCRPLAERQRIDPRAHLVRAKQLAKPVLQKSSGGKKSGVWIAVVLIGAVLRAFTSLNNSPSTPSYTPTYSPTFSQPYTPFSTPAGQDPAEYQRKVREGERIMRELNSSNAPGSDSNATPGDVDVAKSLAKALAQKAPATQPDNPFTFGESNREH